MKLINTCELQSFLWGDQVSVEVLWRSCIEQCELREN